MRIFVVVSPLENDADVLLPGPLGVHPFTIDSVGQQSQEILSKPYPSEGVQQRVEAAVCVPQALCHHQGLIQTSPGLAAQTRVQPPIHQGLHLNVTVERSQCSLQFILHFFDQGHYVVLCTLYCIIGPRVLVKSSALYRE